MSQTSEGCSPDLGLTRQIIKGNHNCLISFICFSQQDWKAVYAYETQIKVDHIAV